MSASGVHNPDVIDVVSHNPQTDIISIGMVEEREWNGSEQMLLELEAKIQNYFSFLVDGQFDRMYPGYVGKPLEIRLFCSTLPDIKTNHFIEQARLKLGPYNIGFVVSQMK
jgi:Family of unknown function (DUF6572)